MGITGLLPFLKKASREVNVKDFKGCTVAIDSYCWLHKGAFACADKLALGEKTDQYVYYCMKYVNNLLSFGVKPIMVFDGCRLPSKENVEKERRERRELYRKKAAQLLREGRRGEARECLQRCVDITPQMALDLMNACRAKGVDCIVAPYEADSQLAYLNRIGIAQIIITEDSDLVLFGCERVIFKMDFAGNGVLVERSQLNKAMDLKADMYTFEKFRYMCILSGCDYLSNLPGIGLGKASKLFKLTRQTDMKTVLRKLPTTLKMGSLEVSSEYIAGFQRAINTFLYQLCYDPRKRKLVPLTPYPPDVDPRELEYAGPYMSPEKAFQISLGNIDINTGKVIADFNPDNFKAKTQAWTQTGTHMLSMWDPQYRPMLDGCSTNDHTADRPSTKGKQVLVKATYVKRTPVVPVKRSREEIEADDASLRGELSSTYTSLSPSSTSSPKRLKCEWDEDTSPAGSPKALSPRSENTPPRPGRPESPGPQELTEDPSELPTKSMEYKENVQSPRNSPAKIATKNRFAVHGGLKKGVFNLNAGRHEVREVHSRFFATSKPLPKTNFFHQLGEHLPNVPSSASEPKSEQVTEDLSSLEEDLCANTKLDPGEVDSKSTDLNTSTDQDSTNDKQTPYGSFGFHNKLTKFKSTFTKGGVSNLKSTPKSKSQFKPVTITKIFEKSNQIKSEPESRPDSQKSACGSENGDTDECCGLSQDSNMCSIDRESFSWTPPSSLSQSLSQPDREPSPPPLPSLPDHYTSSSQTPSSSNGLASFLKVGTTRSFYHPGGSTEHSDNKHCDEETVDLTDGDDGTVTTFTGTEKLTDEVQETRLQEKSPTLGSKVKTHTRCRGVGLTKVLPTPKNKKSKSEGQAPITNFFSKYFFQKKSTDKLQHGKDQQIGSHNSCGSTPQGEPLCSRSDSAQVQRKLRLTSP